MDKNKKILERYILKKIYIAFLGAEFIYSFVFFIQNLFFLSSLIIEKNAPLKESLKLIIYMLPKIFSSTLPFAAIFASLFVTFELASSSELIAINASGISLKHQTRPFLKASIFITFIYFLFLFYIVPIAKEKRDRVINRINIKSVIYAINSGEFNRLTNRFYLFSEMVRKNVFKNTIGFNYNNFNNFEIIYSKKARLIMDEKNLALSLFFYGGKAYVFKNDKKETLSVLKFKKKAISVKLNVENFRKRVSYKNRVDKLGLIKFVNLLKNKDKTAMSLLVKRLSLLFFVFVSFFLGFYLGFSLKRGSVISGAVIYSFFISFSYIFLLNVFVNLFNRHPALSLTLVFFLLFSTIYFTFFNRERIEKPLRIKEKISIKDKMKNSFSHIKMWFETNVLKEMEENAIFSLKLPVLLKYIIFNFLRFFFVFFIILQGVYLLTVTLKIMFNLLKYKANISYGLKYILFSTLATYPLLIPFAFLMSALFFFIYLDVKNELIAMKSSGISIFSIVTPVVYLSLIISVFLLFFTTVFSPLSRKKSTEIYLKINKKKMNTFVYKLRLKNMSVIRSFKNPAGFYWCDYYDFERGEFRNFISVDFDLKSGKLKSLYRATLIKVINNSFFEDNNTFFALKGNDYVSKHAKKPVIWDNVSFFKTIEPVADELTQSELRDFISRKKAIGIKPYKYITNYYYRFSSAFSPFVLLLIGLPFALISEGRKKTPVSGIVLSMFLIILYYALTSFFLSLGAKHYLPSFLAAWIINVFFLFSGIFFFTKIKT